MIMDINKELHEIIFKYHLDRHYPHYKNMCEAKEILKDVINNIIHNNKKVVFVGDDKTGIAFIRNLSKDYPDIHFVHYDRGDKFMRHLDEIEWNEYEQIYLISFYGAEYAERWFRLHNIQYEWIYDIFEWRGVVLQREFFSFGKENLQPLTDTKAGSRSYSNRGHIEIMQCELYTQQSKYKNAGHCQTKRIALEKCLFLVICMRNFLLAEEYVLLLSKEDKLYECLWKEIQDLLNTIRVKLHSRNQKDIILYWLDCIPYGDERDMPYLQDIKKDSIVFENAFTNVGYTKPTLRAMFLGKREIDDRGYRILKIMQENSSVIRLLEEQGYNMKIFSGILNESFSGKYSPDQFYILHHEPFSKKLWDMLANILQEERNTVWIVHAMETHTPYFSSKMCDDSYRQPSEQYRLARQETDEQLAFYDSFISKAAYRIYMSDHGNSHMNKHHVLFNIYHESLKPRRIDGMFSLLDFGVILRQIILDGDIEEEVFLREYVEIGNMDWYNKMLIEKLFKNKEVLSMIFFGWKGIVDKQYVYRHYRTGQEWLQKRENMTLNVPLLFYAGADDICDPTLLLKYRKLAGEYPQDIVNDEQSKYSQYVYVLYNNILKHNDMEKRIDMINQILEKYPERSVGIRMGGTTSAILYQILSKDNKRKIWGFIDKNEQCLCSQLHLPVLPVEQIEKKTVGVKAILISSYTYLKILREESETWPADIDVLDIYDYLEKNGIECRGDFYKISGIDEDYDVGFPFDETKEIR